jgi:aminoglycoside phosphotransferase (APT) family kinase protein
VTDVICGPSAIENAVRDALNLDDTPFVLERLAGGASRQTWIIKWPKTPRSDLVLQIATPRSAQNLSMRQQASIMNLVRPMGVPVPEVVVASDARDHLDFSLMITKRVVGESSPRIILFDQRFAEVKKDLAMKCGEILGHLHSTDVSKLPEPNPEDTLTYWVDRLRETGETRLAFELAVQWLETTAPARGRTSLVHGDFRLGNFIVDPEGVSGIVDWELAHAGDPVEDLGYLCVRSWRFGGVDPVGGFGSYDDLLAGYESSSGVSVGRQELLWWQMFGTLKWGIISLVQLEKYLSGLEATLELAAIGRRVSEVEYDLMELLP